MEKPETSSLTVQFDIYYYTAKKSMAPFSMIIPGAHLKDHIIA